MFSDLKVAWSMFTQADKRKTSWTLLLVTVMALAEISSVLSIMPFLSVLARTSFIHENHWLQSVYTAFGFQSDHAFIVGLGLISISIVTTTSIFKSITLHLINRFVHQIRHSLSSRLLSKYLHQPYEFFLNHNTAVLNSNVLSEVDQLLFNLILPLSQLIAQGLIVLAMLVLVFWYNPFVAITVIGTIGLLYSLIYLLVRKRLNRIGKERQFANHQRFLACNEALSGIKDVKVTHSAHTYQSQYDNASMAFARRMADSETLAHTPRFLVEAVGYTGLIVIALFLMHQSDDIARVLPALGMYGFAAYRMLPAVQTMYRGFADLKFSSSTLQSIHSDMMLPSVGEATSQQPLVPRHAIQLDNISYAYPSMADNPVLKNFSLRIQAGNRIGITGQTGAGKSTLMDILLALLQPQTGTLSVDGIPIDKTNASAWQNALGYVPQHIYLADASVKENIAFGVSKELIDMQAVEKAARIAQIHDFIIGNLADGYDTNIGDRGIRLSGGQQQRIGIARALYRDPPVLFMDEATSALDSQTEQLLTEAIQNLPDGKTVVIITHRQASLVGCDQIINIASSDNQHDLPENG